MTVLVLIISAITFALLYIFGNYYNDMGVTKEKRMFVLVVAVIMLIINLSVASDYFISFSKYRLESYILEDHWFLSSLTFGAILFLLVQIYQTIKHQIMISKLSPEELEKYQEEDLKKREDAQENYRKFQEEQAKRNAEKRAESESTNLELKCPKCGSTNLTAHTKGFGLGKAAVGGVLLGPVGLLGGVIGSKKPVFICLKCGNQFQK